MTVCSLCHADVFEDSVCMDSTCKHVFHASCLAKEFKLSPKLTAAAIPKICPCCSSSELSNNLPQVVIDRLVCLEYTCSTLTHDLRTLTGTVQQLSNSFKSLSSNLPPITEFTPKPISSTKKIQSSLSELLCKVNTVENGLEYNATRINDLELRLKKCQQKVSAAETSVLDDELSTPPIAEPTGKQDSWMDKFRDELRDVSCRAENAEIASEYNGGRIDDLNVRSLRMESAQLASHLILSGVPEMEGENLTDFLQATCCHIGAEISTGAFLSVERMGKLSSERSRPFLVKCASPAVVDTIINAKKRFGCLHAKQLPGSWAQDFKIYINRRRPSLLYKLRDALLEQKKSLSPRSVWFGDFWLFVRLPDVSRPLKIYSMKEVQSLGW
uniref:RING-type domain-containing protein n=1 Tax=Bracon brevicornis TaxID=1563983 RepID=A0A6V7JKN1_9HYME